jgi:hypothetical protein
MAIGTSIKVSLDTKAVARGFANIKAGFRRLSRSVSAAGKAMMAPFMKLKALLAPILAGGAGVVFLRSASKQAAEIETLTASFTTLLGTVEKAQARIKELEKFSIRTPFEPKDVISASKLMETLGGEVLATGKGLQMVGDAAAVANQPLEEVGLHIGRMFGALKAGTAMGESLTRLQELGLITGSTRLKFERFSEAQRKGERATLSGAQALELLQHALRNTEGAMDRQSRTFAGRISTMRGHWQALMQTLGAEVNIGLGKVVDHMINELPKLSEDFRKAGEFISNKISTVLDLFKAGQLKDALWESLKFAGTRFGELLLIVFRKATMETIDMLNKSAPLLFRGSKDIGVNNMANIALAPFTGGKVKLDRPMQNVSFLDMLADPGNFKSSSQHAKNLSEMSGQAKVISELGARLDWLQRIGYTLEEANEIGRQIVRKTQPAGAFNR